MTDEEYARRAKHAYDQQGYLIIAWVGPKKVGFVQSLTRIPDVRIQVEAASSIEEYKRQPGIRIKDPIYLTAHYYRCKVLD